MKKILITISAILLIGFFAIVISLNQMYNEVQSFTDPDVATKIIKLENEIKTEGTTPERELDLGGLYLVSGNYPA